MASSSEPLHNKTSTGYPAPTTHIATGYPAPAAVSTADNNYPFPYSFHPLEQTSSAYNPDFRHAFLRRLCFFSIVCISLITLFGFTGYLVFRPHLPEFRIASAAVSRLNLTQSELTASWVFNFSVRNPNRKLSINFERVEARVVYGDEMELARTQLPPFFQDRGNESMVVFRVGVIGEYVGEDVVRRISKERERGSVEFGVRVLSLVRFTSGVWRMREHVMRVYCDSIRIGSFLANGTGISEGPSKKCDVYL
ncbi:Late embryogenesis abundant (LEA) hydroxyproline-rich glycoprotein family [Euphorbia peplus]|nr:Late embryogenesis abundant (LEA) hydroxyproline-rich glycoprotein family [Euphorbia peplus]